MKQRSFGRGQMEWALWRAILGTKWNRQSIPQIVLTRIKRLLEIDRDPALIEGVEKPPKASYAFAPPPDASAESNYTLPDAVCLAIALDLLDAGFKQREIVFRMRYLRPDLEKRLTMLMDRPSPLTRTPTRRDDRCFLVLGQMEMAELYAGLTRRGGKARSCSSPLFCDGLKQLTRYLEQLMPLQRRVAALVEIAGLAHAVAAALDQAPLIRRGRPKT